jgi:hypothetical protein
VVYVDANGNGLFDTGEPTDTTSRSGVYALSDLDPGTYVVRVVQQASYRLTAPPGGSYTVTLSSGQTAKDRVFGVQRIA